MYPVQTTDWRAELARGALAHAALAALEGRPSHGYDLLAVLHAHGFDRLKGGTLYPLLHRLEERGLVLPAWDTAAPGAARKVYSLTPAGIAALAEAEAAWAQVGASLAALRNHERSAS